MQVVKDEEHHRYEFYHHHDQDGKKVDRPKIKRDKSPCQPSVLKWSCFTKAQVCTRSYEGTRTVAWP